MTDIKEDVASIRISIVIRTFDSAKTLQQVIKGLNLGLDDEIIVVDSGSTDRTLEIAQSNGTRIISALGPFNYSKSLNLGFRAAQNPWVLVLSSHCIPLSSQFLNIHRDEIVQFPNSVIVGYAPATFSGRSDDNLPSEETSFFLPEDYIKMSRICGNGNTIYRRSAWEEYPFDETVRTTEDKLWLLEMTSRNFGFAYVPAPKCLSRNRGNWRYMFRKGYSDARAARDSKHKPMTLLQLGGTIKNISKSTFLGEIDWGSWGRCLAHSFGHFIGSHLSENNSPSYERR